MYFFILQQINVGFLVCVIYNLPFIARTYDVQLQLILLPHFGQGKIFLRV